MLNKRFKKLKNVKDPAPKEVKGVNYKGYSFLRSGENSTKIKKQQMGGSRLKDIKMRKSKEALRKKMRGG